MNIWHQRFCSDVTGSSRRVDVIIISMILLIAWVIPAMAQEYYGTPGVATQRAVTSLQEMSAQNTMTPSVLNESDIEPPFMPVPGDLPVPGNQRIPDNLYPNEYSLPGWGVLQPFPPAPIASPLPSASFFALGDPNTSIPPDTHGAVGLNHLMVTENPQVRIQDRSGSVISTVSLNSFWSSLGNPTVFDPKVLYEPFNNRWVFTSCANSRSAASSLLIGVSQTSNPTGSWNLYRIDADPSDAVWVDYPSIGFNKDWIVVQVNMYAVSNNAFVRSNIYVFNKADLYAGGAGLYTLITNNSIGGVQVPVITYDNTLSTMYLIQTWNSNSGGSGYLRMHTITGNVGSEVLTLGSYVSTPNPWDYLPNAGNVDFAPQLGSTNKIMCNDSRMQNCVYRNGSLWCTQTVFLPAGVGTRSSVQWWKIDTSGGVQQFGRIDDPSGTMFYAYPTIAVNKANHAMVGYSSFSASQYASGNYSFRSALDPLNTLRGDVMLKAGEAPYYKTYGSGRNRWGDYSNTVVDPVNDTDMWTIQEYAAAPSGGIDRFASWWGMIKLSFTISGYVRTPNGSGMAGVTLNGLPGNPVTDAAGFYSATVDFDSSGTVTPSKTGYTFSPASTSYSNVTSDLSQDYTGYRPLTVTIDQASAQTDPTGVSPVNFTVVFNRSVSDFATGDVTISGTAGATTATVTGSGTTYNAAVSGMTGSGTVIASIAANAAHDAEGNSNEASTSTDNTVTYNLFKPDLLIKPGNESSYSFNNIYSDDGNSQTKAQNASMNQTVNYAFKVQNDGGANETFKITGTAGGSGWTVKYCDITTNADVTAQVTGSGWSSGSLAPGALNGVYVLITPNSTIAAGSSKTLVITAISQSDTSNKDVGKAVTTAAATYKSDILVKAGAETSYAFNNIYGTDGSNQTKSLNASMNQTLNYAFRVQNDGNTNDTFKITGPAGTGGWTIRYYDLTTNADVTSQITGSGWSSGTLAPGVTNGVYVKVTPGSSAASGSVNTLLITATSQGNTSNKDVCKALTTAVATRKTDILMKAGAETSYSFDNIYSTDGSNQTKSLNAAASQRVNYGFRVQNDGNVADSYKITGPAGGSGWTIVYKDLATNADVTSQVTGSGWASGTLASGATGGVYVLVTPDGTVINGSQKILTITAVSQSDASIKDVCKAVTTKQ
ncbi:MAG: hypothetical protein ACYC27_03530 [Armatimonadota bacterium]